mmetsp:Transcript_32802/g.59995  ORF Transcript_32802/g.59995 Transcript_32802/m.59995 type:complete len:345 (-) Transcript_32802:98-1132(-)
MEEGILQLAVPRVASSCHGLMAGQPQTFKPELCGARRHRTLRGVAVQVLVLASAALVALRTRQRRPQICRRAGQRQVKQQTGLPRDLYELLGVARRASSPEIRAAYLKMQKVFHPDIAGASGAEVSALLNSAYTLLSDDKERAGYDKQLGNLRPATEAAGAEANPVWKWKPKLGKQKPVYDGIPRSRSLWNRVPSEGRGSRWVKKEFVFVDEFRCISCWNCAATAPKTFTIDADNQRARVFAQWGDTEEDLNYAVMSCPVDCIDWVSREELQVLEHVTANYMYEYGSVSRRVNPYNMANSFQQRLSKRSSNGPGASVTAQMLHAQVANAISNLATDLREAAGWR